MTRKPARALLTIHIQLDSSQHAFKNIDELVERKGAVSAVNR